MATLTDNTIQKALRDAKASGVDVWLTDQTKARGIGRLRLRARPGKVGMWYFRYSDPDGKQVQLPIGAYDANNVTGLGLKEARGKAGELSKQYQDGHRDLRAHIEHQQAEEAARIETAKRAREEAARKAKSGSLKALLQGYGDYLKAQGKQSTKDVTGLFRRHVFEAFPVIAEMRAASITHRDITTVLAKLIEAGKGRTAAKLVSEISTGMVKRKEAREPFQLRDLRRTCETMLASMGISRDVRAQLLSHGLGGVQQVHYDKYEYMVEKRNALEAWGNRLKEIAGGAKADNVVAIRGQA